VVASAEAPSPCMPMPCSSSSIISWPPPAPPFIAFFDELARVERPAAFDPDRFDERADACPPRERAARLVDARRPPRPRDDEADFVDALPRACDRPPRDDDAPFDAPPRERALFRPPLRPAAAFFARDDDDEARFVPPRALPLLDFFDEDLLLEDFRLVAMSKSWGAIEGAQAIARPRPAKIDNFC